MFSGKVRWFNNTKGYGFIASDDGGDDLYVHYSRILTHDKSALTDGQKVEYDIGPGEEDRRYAINVRPF